ncbi:MAG: PD-(D/E)XK nuclease family protein, partial [Kovacikia sp.]
MKRRSLLIYGYFQPRLDELAFIDAIAGKDSVFCLPIADHDLFTPQKPALEQLQQWGWQIDATPVASPAILGKALAQRFLSQPVETIPPNLQAAGHAYPNQNAEARSVLAQIKQLLHDGIPAREIVIVTRDEAAYGPPLLEIAWEYGIPLRALYSIPLSSTRVGAWLTLVLQVIQQQFPFELTARLLSHPLSIAAGADFWATVRQQRPTKFDAWQATVQQLTGLDLSPLKLPNRARRDTWVEKLRDIFQAFNLRRRAARWARESVAYNALETGLVALSQPESEILTWQGFADEVLASLATLTTPAQPGRGGVELHTPRSVMGARYRQVFIIGGVEGKLPAPVQNDPILDFYERQQLRTQGIPLPGAAEAARREAFEFYALLHTATEQFTMSYVSLEGEPSAYFKRLDLSFSPVPTVAVASPEATRQLYLRQSPPLDDPVLEGAIAAFQVEEYRESSDPGNEYDGIVGIPFDYSQHWFSASQLTQLGQCPFKWFANRVLKLAEVEELDEELNPGLRGNLYHKVLELAIKAVQTDP